MILDILWNILMPVFLIIAAGFVIARQLPLDLRTLSNVLFYLLMPCLIFTTLSHLKLDVRSVGHICIFYIGMIIALATLGGLLARTQTWDSSMRSAFLLTVLFQNAGNYGIPVSQLEYVRDACNFSLLG